MRPSNALASLAVSDLDRSASWYERLFGPARRPMPEVMEWHFDAGGGLQVYEGPERSGNGSCTIVVDDIDAVADELRMLGIDAPEPAHQDAVDTIMIKDPDGNSIAFAHPKTPELIS